MNFGDTITLTASGGNTYSWSNGVNSQSINVVAQDTQEYVVTATVGNCTDKDTVTVFTRPRPELTYLTDTIYNGVSGVNPEVGTDDQYFEYKVKYEHPNNIPPRQGYPIVGIDMNGDGDFTGSMDMQVSMNELDPADNNYADGKIYTFTRGFAPNQDLNYSFLAYDVLESPAKGNAVQLQSGPRVVDDSLDLHLYANDISFSNNNPVPGENVTITATINNSSSFPASQTQVNFYQEGTLLAQKSIGALAPNSEDTVSITQSFANPEYYPIKVVIDENNVIPESNELNNFAIRPLVVGDFATAGAINVSSNLGISNPCVGGFSYLEGSANYANNVNTSAEVAGAEVKVTIQETGDVFKGYTDQNGNFKVWINVPSSIGNYTVNAQITDFSIVGSTTNHVFTTSNCQPSNPVTGGYTSSGSGSWCNCASPSGNNIDTTQTPDIYNPDLVVQSYHISPSEINPDTNEYIQLYSSFENRGDISADSFNVTFLVDGNQIGNSVMVPVLGPGLDGTVQATDSFSTSQNGFHEIRVVVDSTDQVAESNETNNAATRGLVVGNQTDLGFLEPNGLKLSNPSPTKGSTVDIIATLKNYGGASGNGTLTFYYVNGADTTTLGSNSISINGQDTSTSSIQWVADTSVGQLYASISNTSQDVNPQNNDAFYNLGFPEPSFIKLPEDTALCGGNAVTLTVDANNAQSYQWQFEGNDIPNATDSFLVLNNLSLSDSGDYRCIVSNGFKADTSMSATVAVSPLANAGFSYQQNQFTISFSHNAQHYNSLEWKFGDGNSSTDPNPSHTYSANGTYDACLIATNSCNADTTCQSITISVTVPDTIKGEVDKSGNALDEGDVSLWEVNGSDYTKVDSVELQASDNGKFTFGAVSAGSYVVKSSPASSSQLNNIIPTYHQDKVFWQNATQITTNDNGQVHTAPISLQTGTPLANGPGSIVGNISEAGPGKRLGPGDPQGGVEVLLMKTNDDPLDYTYSDANGNYGFNNLPFDTYKVHVEITGFNANDRTVVISTNDPSDTTDFDVDPDQDTVINNGIKRQYERLPFTYQQYPNPAKDELNLKFTTEQRQKVELSILNSLGKRVEFKSINLKSGKNEHSLDVQSLGSGVYFLQLRSSKEDGMVETEKLIISK